MKHYTVCTPTYTDYGHPYGEPPEPPETGADCVSVEAPNKRAAKIAAVREMRRQGMTWVEDQTSDGASPFTGLVVYEEGCPHGSCWCDRCTAKRDHIECASCLAEWAAEDAAVVA